MTEARNGTHPLARLLLRERVVILGALALIVLLSWLYLLGLTRPSGAMGGMAMGPGRRMPWTEAEFALQLVMWWVMMAGMMLPSAAPMILTFATINGRRRAQGRLFVPTAIFVAGYLVAWGAFSLLAALAQGGLERAALTAPMMPIASPALGGIVVIAAGLYQFTPLKGLCLRQCRSPLAFVLQNWQDGPAGAFRMGWRHGIYCLGCCWVLMALLFVAGVMNLLWVAALAAFVFVEKLFPAGEWIARASGALMLGFGIYLLTTA